MDDLQVLQNYKAARIILDLPPHTSSCDTQVKLHWKPPMYCTEELSTVPFLFINQLITFFLVPLNFVLIVIFMHDYNSQFRNNLRKPQPKEGGAIGPVSTLLQMSGIPLIYHLGKTLLYPVLNKTCPK